MGEGSETHPGRGLRTEKRSMLGVESAQGVETIEFTLKLEQVHYRAQWTKQMVHPPQHTLLYNEANRCSTRRYHLKDGRVITHKSDDRPLQLLRHTQRALKLAPNYATW